MTTTIHTYQAGERIILRIEAGVGGEVVRSRDYPGFVVKDDPTRKLLVRVDDCPIELEAPRWMVRPERRR